MEESEKSEGVRYTLEHIGDIMVDALDVAVDAVAVAGKYSWEGVKIAGQYLMKGASVTVDYMEIAAKYTGNALGGAAKYTGNALGGAAKYTGDKVGGAAKMASVSGAFSAKGVILTYDLHELERKRKIIIKKLGESIAAARKTRGSDFAGDSRVSDLLEALDETDAKIAACLKEREDLLKGKKAACVSKPVERASVPEPEVIVRPKEEPVEPESSLPTTVETSMETIEGHSESDSEEVSEEVSEESAEEESAEEESASEPEEGAKPRSRRRRKNEAD